MLCFFITILFVMSGANKGHFHKVTTMLHPYKRAVEVRCKDSEYFRTDKEK